MRTLSHLLTAAMVLILVACGTVLGADDGWTLLMANRNAEARVALQAELKANPQSQRALLGMIMLLGQEDDAVAELQCLATYYQVAPDSWQAQAYWARVVSLADYTGRYAVLDGIARQVLARTKTPEMRVRARLVLAESALRAGATGDAQREWARMGFIRQWQVIGPFDNVSDCGLKKAYPPELEIDLAKTYPGLNDMQLAWHSLGVVSPQGNCEIGSCLGDDEPSVFYAVTAVFSAQEQPVRMCCEPTGASRIALNGVLLFTDDLYREPDATLDADSFAIPATLHAGWNTLLVKIASNERMTAAFRVRFTTPEGEDLPGLRTDPTQAKSRVMPAPVAAPAHPVPGSATMLRAQPPSTEIAMALGRQLWIYRDFQASEAVLRAALAQTPDNAWLHALLSDTLRDDAQSDEARSERDAARKLNANIVSAELDYLSEQSDRLAPAEHLQQLQALRTRFPSSASVLWALSDAYSAAEMEADALKMANLAAQINGGPNGIDTLINTLASQGKDTAVDQVLTTALARFPTSSDLLETRVSRLENQGKGPQTIAALQRLLQVATPRIWYYRRLAKQFEGVHDLRKASATLDTAGQLFPQNANLCVYQADILRELNETPKAIALYQTAIRLDPSDVDLREKLQLLTGGKSIFDLAPAVPAEPILAEAAKMKPAPGMSAVVLLDETRELVYPDYATDARMHTIIKVFDAAGVKQFQYHSLAGPSSGFPTIERSRIISADGKIRDLTDEAYARASFPSLAPGDVIDLEYRVKGYQQGGLAHNFWVDQFFSQELTPVAQSRYVLITPAQMKFSARPHGPVPEPKITKTPEWAIHEWTMTDIPAVRFEDSQVGERDNAIWLDISTVKSWSDIVRWYRDLAGPRCVPDDIVRAKAAELTKEATTEEAKIRALVTFVARKIQYQSTPFRNSQFIPTEGKQVLRDQYGDCKDKSALLTALLAAVGIKADMVLLSTRDEGLTPYLPSPRFTHAITRITTGHGPLWVDATADKMAYGVFPLPDQGVPALVINENSADLVEIPVQPIEQNAVTTSYDLALAANGKLTGTLTFTSEGYWAWLLRSMLKSVPEAQRDSVLRYILAQLVKNSTFENGKMEQVDDPDVPLVMRITFSVRSYGTPAGDLLLIPLPWGDLQDGELAMLDQPDRKCDFENAAACGIKRTIIRLRLPPGRAPLQLEPKVETKTSWGSYALTYRMEGDVLQAECLVRGTTLRVPLAEVPRFCDYTRNLQQELSKQIVLKKQ